MTVKKRKRSPSPSATVTPPPTSTDLSAVTSLSVPAATSTDQPMISITTWNVNSWNASMKKGFMRYIELEKPSVLCIQETKLQQASAADMPQELKHLYPHRYFYSGTRKKGYAGSALLSKVKPIQVWNGWEYAHELLKTENETANAKSLPKLDDDEGRIITAEFEDFFLCTCYVPNAGQKLERKSWKCEEWMPYLGRYLKALDEMKPVIWTGDLNVCREAIDLARPKENYNKTAGYTQDEIDAMNAVMKDVDLVDCWRERYPKLQAYTYFSYRFQCRQKHLGWRLDYFCVSRRLLDRILDTTVREEVYGPSDHCPMTLFTHLKLES